MVFVFVVLIVSLGGVWPGFGLCFGVGSSQVGFRGFWAGCEWGWWVMGLGWVGYGVCWFWRWRWLVRVVRPVVSVVGLVLGVVLAV